MWRLLHLGFRRERPIIIDQPLSLQSQMIYLASLLIGSGLDVKVVQHRLRHGSAKTTLDTY